MVVTGWSSTFLVAFDCFDLDWAFIGEFDNPSKSSRRKQCVNGWSSTSLVAYDCFDLFWGCIGDIDKPNLEAHRKLSALQNHTKGFMIWHEYLVPRITAGASKSAVAKSKSKKRKK